MFFTLHSIKHRPSQSMTTSEPFRSIALRILLFPSSPERGSSRPRKPRKSCTVTIHYYSRSTAKSFNLPTTFLIALHQGHRGEDPGEQRVQRGLSPLPRALSVASVAPVSRCDMSGPWTYSMRSYRTEAAHSLSAFVTGTGDTPARGMRGACLLRSFY